MHGCYKNLIFSIYIVSVVNDYFHFVLSESTSTKVHSESTTQFPAVSSSQSSTSTTLSNTVPPGGVVHIKQEPVDIAEDEPLPLPPGFDLLPRMAPTVPILYMFQQ